MATKRGITFLKDEAGDWSSKRLFSLACLVAAVGLALLGKDATTCGVFLGAGTATLGVTALTKT